MGCWSCQSDYTYCYRGCECAKCMDPVGYGEWKDNNPKEHGQWWESQQENNDEQPEYGFEQQQEPDEND